MKKNPEMQNAVTAAILAFVIVIICVVAALYCFSNGDLGFGLVFSGLTVAALVLSASHNNRKAGGEPLGHRGRVEARGRVLKAQQRERKPRP